MQDPFYPFLQALPSIPNDENAFVILPHMFTEAAKALGLPVTIVYGFSTYGYAGEQEDCSCIDSDGGLAELLPNQERTRCQDDENTSMSDGSNTIGSWMSGMDEL